MPKFKCDILGDFQTLFMYRLQNTIVLHRLQMWTLWWCQQVKTANIGLFSRKRKSYLLLKWLRYIFVGSCDFQTGNFQFLTGKLIEKLQILIILKGTQNESFAQKFPVSLFPLLLPKHKNLLFFLCCCSYRKVVMMVTMHDAIKTGAKIR